jgi:hypothetical protein
MSSTLERKTELEVDRVRRIELATKYGIRNYETRGRMHAEEMVTETVKKR